LAQKSKKFGDFVFYFPILWGENLKQSCRSRKTLQNEYLVAKIGVDTAENEPSQVGENL
jgi:hypothetical protein